MDKNYIKTMSSKSNGTTPPPPPPPANKKKKKKNLGMGVEGRSWVQDPIGACLKLPVKNVIQS